MTVVLLEVYQQNGIHSFGIESKNTKHLHHPIGVRNQKTQKKNLGNSGIHPIGNQKSEQSQARTTHQSGIQLIRIGNQKSEQSQSRTKQKKNLGHPTQKHSLGNQNGIHSIGIQKSEQSQATTHQTSAGKMKDANTERVQNLSSLLYTT